MGAADVRKLGYHVGRGAWQVPHRAFAHKRRSFSPYLETNVNRTFFPYICDFSRGFRGVGWVVRGRKV